MNIDARIENWRLYFKDRPRISKIGSLESNYKEPPVTKEMLDALKDQVFEVKLSVRPSIDVNDAIKVEKAIIKLPMKYKMVLVVNEMYPYYLHGSNFRKTCKTIGISIDNTVFDSYLLKSKIMLENILQSTK